MPVTLQFYNYVIINIIDSIITKQHLVVLMRAEWPCSQTLLIVISHDALALGKKHCHILLIARYRYSWPSCWTLTWEGGRTRAEICQRCTATQLTQQLSHSFHMCRNAPPLKPLLRDDILPSHICSVTHQRALQWRGGVSGPEGKHSQVGCNLW